MAQDYDSCELEFTKITGGNLLGWSFKLGESRLGATGQTQTVVPISAASLTPSQYTPDADGALSLDPALASASMSFHVPSPVPAPPLSYKDVVTVTYAGSLIFQGIVTQVAVEVALDGFNSWEHAYTFSLSDIAAGMLNSGPGLVSVPAEDPLTRLRRWFTVDTSLLTTDQLTYILSLMHEAQVDQDKTYLAWAREFTELTETPLRVTPADLPVWNHLQVYPHPVSWNGTPPTPDITSDDGCWINSLTEKQAEETGGELLPTAVQVVGNDTRFLTSGSEHVEIPPVPLGQFRLGVNRLGSSGEVPLGYGAGSVVEIYGDVMAISKLTHAFSHKKLVTSMELVRPVNIDT